jgi:hypothetical protein
VKEVHSKTHHTLPRNQFAYMPFTLSNTICWDEMKRCSNMFIITSVILKIHIMDTIVENDTI